MNDEIILYSLRELHLPVLKPLYRELKKRGYQNVHFMAPPFKEGEGSIAEEGLRLSTIDQLVSDQFSFKGHYRNQPASCVFLADVCYERVEGWGPTICVGHGTISKNIYFIDEPIVRRENFADLLCVPGPWYLDTFKNEVHIPIKATGFPKMDELVLDHTNAIDEILNLSKFTKQKPILLFAPTYNPELSAHQFLYKYLPKLTEKGFQVLVKLHGATESSWKLKYQEICQADDQLFFAVGSDLTPYMLLADLMISDFSSAYVEFLTQDKPLLLYDNPLAYNSNYFNPKTVEIQVRECAYIFTQFEQLVDRLEKIKSGNDEKKTLRNRWNN